MPVRFKVKPTAGYATQRQAIVALHVDGLGSLEISRRLGCTREAVHASVAWYRKKTGHIIVYSERAPSPQEEALWDGDENDRRLAFAIRQRHGAREALRAMGASL